MRRFTLALLVLLSGAILSHAQKSTQAQLPVKTAPVCDTREYAEQYIALANQYNDAEVFEKINAGHPMPVCGILKVQFIPEALVTHHLLMRNVAVDIFRIRVFAAQLSDFSYVTISGGMTLYIILVPVTPA